MRQEETVNQIQRKQGKNESQLIRFGVSADCHLQRGAQNEVFFREFVEDMVQWKPDFVIDLGDLACQTANGQTTQELHDAQLNGLICDWGILSKLSCPVYIVMGNHDLGWIKGGDETVTPDDLYADTHSGEHITKDEFLNVTGMPHRYYSFDVNGYHFIVLDGNNESDDSTPKLGHDGVVGGYFIDDVQKEWLAKDLADNSGKIKVVFCHEELHHTQPEGSGEGGNVPFTPAGNEGSYVDNGWQLRNMFKADGMVLVCFSGHKHVNRWTVYGGVNYITLAATHREGSNAKVTISDKLYLEGHGNQRNYTVPM